MKTGRPPKHPPCPLCNEVPRAHHAPYYKCACRNYIERNGELQPTRSRKEQARKRRQRRIHPPPMVESVEEFERMQE